MYFKRFLQLFVIYLIAVLVFLSLVASNFLQNKIVTVVVAIIISYIILTLPLVILTIVKAKKKENIVGSQSQSGELTQILKDLPGYIAFSYQNSQGQLSTTIMSFVQSTKEENVLYMVAEKETRKAKDLDGNTNVAFTTWFEKLDNGKRLSSNQATAQIFIGSDNQSIIDEQPQVLDVHENALNMAIIKVTIQSALYESFKDDLKVLKFD
ncbi:MAG: pyridoxamine 5'-phosphate oxidase family protein [Streptococcaceae bacterium]|nr:pyridoxamine 5'-phosphate oxidase family protein [Streptococcaceae bacterium]MCL2858667.1 pyridoxamine 5'-phosphate oxidase family protein [Streptococcaceae bacterium]